MTTIYMYQCKICGERIEREAKAPVPKCPVCNGKMERKFHTPNVIYKADGFTGAQKDER